MRARKLAVEGPASAKASTRLTGTNANLAATNAFFRKKTLVLLALVIGFFVINGVSGAFVDFDFVSAVVDIPAGIAWMAAEFMPTVDSLSKLESILPALGSTILASVASSCIAAVFAFVLAVLGSRTTGIGGPTSIIVRAIASIFRNIPVVAWALVLLFSFKQSEFTGFLALFLTSFGYLTRCFLETIDEMSTGPIEALRAAGATYFQIVVQCVMPMCITSIISWVLYMIETNIRDATLVGILTGTGIGFVFDVYYKSFRYDVAGLTLVTIVLVVIACETLSNYIRRRIM